MGPIGPIGIITGNKYEFKHDFVVDSYVTIKNKRKNAILQLE